MKRSCASYHRLKIRTVRNNTVKSCLDAIATEEPLEIRLVNSHKTIAITMRTPGADFDLVTGFLYSEGIISERQDLQSISYCVDPKLDGQQRYNIVNIQLREGLASHFPSLERHFFLLIVPVEFVAKLLLKR